MRRHQAIGRFEEFNVFTGNTDEDERVVDHVTISEEFLQFRGLAPIDHHGRL